MYVPAFPILFGSMDVLLKHYRRYTRAGLCQLLTESGFEIVTSRYCNFLGFWAWFLNNRILRITSQKSNQVQFFDSVLLPIQARLETYWQPWVGQNLFVMARRNG